VVHHNFKSAYDGIQWRNDEGGLKDGGVAELQDIRWLMNATAQRNWLYAQQSEDGGKVFLCKHLLIQWQRGEAYFAEKLLI
jgi:deoxyribodipyrimidine photo-lyase